MERINEINSKKSKKGEIAKMILACIGITGIAIVGVAAPGIFRILPRPRRKEYSRSQLDRSLQKLLESGMVKFNRGARGWRVELTEKGLTEFTTYEMRQKLLQPEKYWKGKWHILVFDIEEKRKKVREKVRRALSNMGFCRLQDSVWVYPFECEEVMELLRTKYGVRHEALYIKAEKIAKDKWLRRHFSLSD